MKNDDEIGSSGITFTWRIENFSYCLEKEGECIDSPIFFMNSAIGRTAWLLKVYPREGEEEEEEEEGSFAFCLYKDIYGADKIFVDYKLSILADDGSLQESIEKQKEIFPDTAPWGLLKYVADGIFPEKKNLYFPQNTLTLRCHMSENGTTLTSPEQRFARTRIGVKKLSGIWSIENFSTYKLKEDNLVLIFLNLKHELLLKFYITDGLVCEHKVRIDILQTNTNQKNLTNCKISVIDSEGSFAYSTTDEHRFEKKEDIQIWSFPISIQRNALLESKSLYLPDDALSIHYDCAISIGVVYSELEDIKIGQNATPHLDSFMGEIHQGREGNAAKLPNSLNTDLNKLYAERTLCDFNLRAGSETYPVHKSILSARSPVFRALISSDMTEEKTDLVDIPDLDSDTVKRMLLFMYTDTIENMLWEDISKLYYAADKYTIEALKQKCSSYLVSNLCTSNACEALELGDMHHDDALKAASVKFIFQNDRKILHSDEWAQLLKRKSQLAAETMHSMYLKKIG